MNTDDLRSCGGAGPLIERRTNQCLKGEVRCGVYVLLNYYCYLGYEKWMDSIQSVVPIQVNNP